MSRSKAMKTFTTTDLAEHTAGVECRKGAGVVDEIPGAYNDLDQVIASPRDLVEVVAHLKQIVCVKGQPPRATSSLRDIGDRRW
jgi:tRNA-splicing ligase RtcB